jgi:hypothetical protein
MPDRALEMESRQLALQLDREFAEPDFEFPAYDKGEESSSGCKWSIVMEEVWFPCFGSYPNLQVHSSEEEARSAFESLKGPRILLDADGVEVSSACVPWKTYALRMMRQKLARKCYPLPCHQARHRDVEDSPSLIDFSDNEFFHSDDFTYSNTAVELPRKALPSDVVSTIGDLGSSRTTHSEFTVATLESTGSSRIVPPMPQQDEAQPSLLTTSKPNGLADESVLSSESIDICQSTTSSVYRLLDIDSRSGSVLED